MKKLKRWKTSSKLRRICLASIAKKVETDNPSRRLAETVFRVFNTERDGLTCEQLAHALSDALVPPSSSSHHPSKSISSPVCASLASADSAWPSQNAGSPSGSGTFTGLYMRQHM